MGFPKIDRQCGLPLQMQIYQYYRQKMHEGIYLAGDKLPSVRELSRELKVARITVTLAYEKLLINSYIKSVRGIGYQVIFDKPIRLTSQKSPKTKNSNSFIPDTIKTPDDLYVESSTEIYSQISIPDSTAYPWANWKTWNNTPSIKKIELATRYHSPSGLLELKEEISRHLYTSRNINVTSKCIIITNGIQEGLSLLAQLFAFKKLSTDISSCHIVTESPCYSGAWHVFNYYGAKITCVNVDKNGLCVNQLPKEATQLCYVTPSHQYPLGCRLSLARRKTLLQWALLTGAYIIEDDYDSEFSYNDNNLPTLKSLDNQDRVIYAGTFSKTLGPGIRLGYLVCPEPLVQVIKNIKSLNNSGSNWIQQQFIADFMHSRAFHNHLSRLSIMYKERQNYLHKGLKQLFPEGFVWGTNSGLHLSLIAPYSEEYVKRLRKRCLEAGLRFDTLNELQNGSELKWKENGFSAMFFGFGDLSIQKISQMLIIIKKEKME